jgi:hypothetical protein
MQLVLTAIVATFNKEKATANRICAMLREYKIPFTKSYNGIYVKFARFIIRISNHKAPVYKDDALALQRRHNLDISPGKNTLAEAFHLIEDFHNGSDSLENRVKKRTHEVIDIFNDYGIPFTIEKIPNCTTVIHFNDGYKVRISDAPMGELDKYNCDLDLYPGSPDSKLSVVELLSELTKVS